MRKTFQIKLSDLVSDYNRDYAFANLSHSFTGYDPQFTETNGFITFAVNTDEHLTNNVIREKLIHSSFISSVSSGDSKKRVIKVPKHAHADKVLPNPTEADEIIRHLTSEHYGFQQSYKNEIDDTASKILDWDGLDYVEKLKRYHSTEHLMDDLKFRDDFPHAIPHKHASQYPDFAHGQGINGTPLTDTASNNPFTTEQGKSGVDSNLHITETENPQYIIDQQGITDPQRDRVFAAKEEKQEVDEYGLPINGEDDLPQGRKLTDLWGGIGGTGTSNDKSGNS